MDNPPYSVQPRQSPDETRFSFTSATCYVTHTLDVRRKIRDYVAAYGTIYTPKFTSTQWSFVNCIHEYVYEDSMVIIPKKSLNVYVFEWSQVHLCLPTTVQGLSTLVLKPGKLNNKIKPW